MPASDPSAADPDAAAPADELARGFRRHAGQLSRQATVFFAGTLFTVVAGYLFKIYVARQIGAAGMGIYTLGLQTASFAVLLAALGLPEANARFVAVYRGRGESARIRRLFLASVGIVAGTGAIAATVLVAGRHLVAERLYGEPGLATYLPAFALLLPVSALIQLCAQYLRGHEQVARRMTVTAFLQFPVKIAATLALFAAGWGLGGYVAGEVVSQLVGLALLAAFARRQTPPAADLGEHAPPGLDRAVARYAAVMAGINLLGFVAARVDLLLVGVILTAEDVGVYSVAVTTAAFVPLVLTSLTAIFGPIIAGLHARGERALLSRLLHTSTKWCLGLTWPLVATVVAFAPALLALFGDTFRAGGAALALLAVGQLVNVGTGAVGSLLLMAGKERLESAAVAVTAALTLTLDLLLIPRWGIVGAAAANAAGLAAANLLRLWLVRRALGLTPYNRATLRLAVPLATSAAAVAGVYLATLALNRDPAALAPLLTAALAAYTTFLLTAAALALDADDRLLARAVWERLRRPR